ncbi:RHS repeat domain-containing protein [Desulfatibacillum aliphaticivorans]|uniref:RHS repeat domain-containing protein n=1 Tax=Desulfatibacillum aliphaticivorans TaxID=218208 RepID=UPI0012F87361|nr:RHS repeat-associated core domain-containing protein [Desulfatibacillum aliphaticivorans]
MTYAYNSVTHKLDAVTAGGTVYNYSYDANGNITACPKLEGAGSISATLAIDYNVDNMPTQVVKSVSGQTDVTTNFYYDGNGARVRKEVVGESTTFYASQFYEVKNGVATKYIFGADRRIAKITDGEGIQYFSKDHLGSSTVVTDDSGAVVEQADYRPFGEDRFYTGSVATPTPYKYTDQELDESTGLYNYDARHYDPAIGRFISPDSLIPNLYDPQQLNPYAYCSNNPLRYTDPTGNKAGTPFSHPDMAMRDFAICYNGISINIGRELETQVFCVNNYGDKKEYVYTTPMVNKATTGTIEIEAGQHVEKLIHTHGEYLPGTDEGVSPGDKTAAENLEESPLKPGVKLNAEIVAVDPDGSMQGFNPKTGIIRDFNIPEIPSDPKHPNRKTKVDPKKFSEDPIKLEDLDWTRVTGNAHEIPQWAEDLRDAESTDETGGNNGSGKDDDYPSPGVGASF